MNSLLWIPVGSIKCHSKNQVPMLLVFLTLLWNARLPNFKLHLIKASLHLSVSGSHVNQTSVSAGHIGKTPGWSARALQRVSALEGRCLHGISVSSVRLLAQLLLISTTRHLQSIHIQCSIWAGASFFLSGKVVSCKDPKTLGANGACLLPRNARLNLLEGWSSISSAPVLLHLVILKGITFDCFSAFDVLSFWLSHFLHDVINFIHSDSTKLALHASWLLWAAIYCALRHVLVACTRSLRIKGQPLPPCKNPLKNIIVYRRQNGWIFGNGTQIKVIALSRGWNASDELHEMSRNVRNVSLVNCSWSLCIASPLWLLLTGADTHQLLTQHTLYTMSYVSLTEWCRPIYRSLERTVREAVQPIQLLPVFAVSQRILGRSIKLDTPAAKYRHRWYGIAVAALQWL